MIYVVTQQILLESEKYKVISVSESLAMLDKLKECGLDLETRGLDPYLHDITMLQLGNRNFQVVVDITTVNIQLYRNYLMSDRLFIGQNIKFDLGFLFRNNIIIDKVYDTMIAEKLLFVGAPKFDNTRPIGRYSLAALTSKYCNTFMDKSVRNNIINMKNLTDEIIIYGAKDIEYLDEIKEKQEIELKSKQLLKASKYEMAFLVPLAYTEYCGVKLDVDKWKLKMDSDLENLNKAEKELNDILYEEFPNCGMFYREAQGDLFNGFDTSLKSKMNWSSTTQCVKILKMFGFDLRTEEKDSCSSKIIHAQKDVHRIADPYVRYKEASKVVSTYGQNVLNQINPISNRIHTTFQQCDTNTLRVSSGSGGESVSKINFQNFPRDANTRSCFIAGKNNFWISCDYAGQESRILSSVSKDASMLNLFNNHNGDIHSLVAKMTFFTIIGDTPIEDVPRLFKKYRQEAKTIEFAINYGGNAYTIHINNGILLEEAQIIYDNYMKAFPGIEDYQKKQRAFVEEYGYIILNDKTGHKNFVHEYFDFKSMKMRLTQEFWDEYREIPKNSNGKKVPRNSEDIYKIKLVKDYFKLKSEMVKRAINYRCQGTEAVMFKLAYILFWKYLRKNDLVYKVLMTIPAHDEINVEAPKEIAEEVMENVKDCMKRAGNFFLDDIDSPADGELGSCWIH